MRGVQALVALGDVRHQHNAVVRQSAQPNHGLPPISTSVANGTYLVLIAQLGNPWRFVKRSARDFHEDFHADYRWVLRDDSMADGYKEAQGRPGQGRR